MSNIRIPRGWEIPEREATPEHVFWNRRHFLEALGFGGLAWAGAPWALAAGKPLYPAPRNTRFTLDRPLTAESVASHFNNFYEFATAKDQVYPLAKRLTTHPWKIEIRGEVEKKIEIDAHDLIRKMPLEERLYRFRCVEAWAMAVPWTGFPMRRLVELARPRSSARFVRMVSFMRPGEAPGQRRYASYPWPYQEGLTLEEASNELTLLVTGVYGHELPPQHGAPIRLITPWKYGFKSIKSIVRFEFTRHRPRTFWHTAVPNEYGFTANVNPKVPHPRWSQAHETMIGTREVRPTLLYNGYGEWVAGLYS